jgi:hypothetical protein
VALLWPAIPPLIDLPTQMARYRVGLDLGSSPYLSLYYDYRWALFGNLGVDLLVVPLARLFGPELAVKLINACRYDSSYRLAEALERLPRPAFDFV